MAERDRSNEGNAETVESRMPVRRKRSVRRINLRRTMPCDCYLNHDFELRVSTVRIEGSVTEADIWKLSHPVTNHLL
jgi:hypothetical protein